MPKIVDKDMDAELAQQMADAAAGNNNVDGDDDATQLQPDATQQQAAPDVTPTPAATPAPAADDDTGQAGAEGATPTPTPAKPAAAPAGIPKTRFDAINDRRKAAEKEAARLQRIIDAGPAAPAALPTPAAAAATPSADEQLLRQQLSQATRDNVAATGEGDVEKAVTAQLLMADIQGKISALHIPVAAAPDVSAAVEQVNYNAAVTELKTSHPQLNEAHKDYDETAVLEVNDLFDAYVASGKPMDQAMRKAVSYVLPEMTVAALGQGHGEADTRRNVQNANDAAPNIGQAGQAGPGEQKVNWSALSDEDYAAMPESKKKEARGDFRV